MFADFGEVESSDEESAIRMHSESRWPKSSRELMESTSVINSRGVAHDPQNSVLTRFRNIDNILVDVHGYARWVSKFAVNDWLKHANSQVDGEYTSLRRFDRCFAEWSAIGKEQAVVLLGKEERIRTFKGLAIEIFDNWSDLNPLVGQALAQNRLMCLIGDEGGSLLIEDEARWLTTSGEGDLHLSFSNLVYITVGRNGVKITILIFGWAVKRNCQLEKLLVVSLRVICHLIFIILISSYN